MELEVEINGYIDAEEIIELYRANGWSSADKPDQLVNALRNSHTLVTARHSCRIVGLANALSDGHLVVYYSHLLVPGFASSRRRQKDDGGNVVCLPRLSSANSGRGQQSDRFLWVAGIYPRRQV
jgi:hypothetical protein